MYELSLSISKYKYIVPKTISHIVVFITNNCDSLLNILFEMGSSFFLFKSGSSVAQASTFALMCILTVIYTVRSKAYKLCWDGKNTIYIVSNEH